jgi:uncharacterized protein YacL (UPF0231 family)
MRNELLKWAQESKKGGILNGFIIGPKGLAVYIDTLITKINSIPVPSVEGYLEGKVVGDGYYVSKDDTLTALRELKEDCEGEIQEKQREYDWACEEITKWRKNGEEGWQLAEKLTAEVERLKGDVNYYKAHIQYK